MKTWYFQQERKVYTNQFGGESIDYPGDAFWDTYIHSDCDVGITHRSETKPEKCGMWAYPAIIRGQLNSY